MTDEQISAGEIARRADALAAARDTGYHQMADHNKADLIERLQFAVDGDRQLAAALRGAAGALEETAVELDALADAHDPAGAVGFLIGHGAFCLECVPPEHRNLHDLVWPEGDAAQEPCEACGRMLLDVADGRGA